MPSQLPIDLTRLQKLELQFEAEHATWQQLNAATLELRRTRASVSAQMDEIKRVQMPRTNDQADEKRERVQRLVAIGKDQARQITTAEAQAVSAQEDAENTRALLEICQRYVKGSAQ